jgi:hypothetical protein
LNAEDDFRILTVQNVVEIFMNKKFSEGVKEEPKNVNIINVCMCACKYERMYALPNGNYLIRYIVETRSKRKFFKFRIWFSEHSSKNVTGNYLAESPFIFWRGLVNFV